VVAGDVADALGRASGVAPYDEPVRIF